MASMSARAVVFDLFGDYVRHAGGAMGLSALCLLLESFDVRSEAARLAMTRLRREGWFESERTGRTVRYSLTPAALEMLDEGRERIFTRDDAGWDQEWHVVSYQIPEEHRDARDTLRKRLAFLGFGALAPATWIAAHNHSPRITRLAEELEQTADCRLTQLTARSSGLEADRKIARDCWPLEELDAEYARWLIDWQPEFDRIHAGEVVGKAALRVRVELVRSYRRFPFRDPQLPRELLPSPWRGSDAYEAFIDAHQALEEEAWAAFHAVLERDMTRRD